MIKASWPTLTSNLLVLNRREAILTLAPVLTELAQRCGQPGAMHWLPYFLDKAVSGLRSPYLVLLLRPEQGENESLSAENLEAAALFFEYRLFGLRTGAVSTGDAVGFSSIIARKGQRTEVAAIAARALVDRGASIVLATYEGPNEIPATPLLAGWPGVQFAVRRRRVGRTLRLLPTMEATLAQMGKSTRFNLRYYRRRLEKQVPCEYVPDAAAALQHADLHEINEDSLNPVSAEEFRRRVQAASQLPGSFLTGLRDADGRWLSLIGGWRQGGSTVLFWQMNTRGWEKHSLGTVMRSFFLEDEIKRGSKRLLIYGGTPHPMRHAFAPDTVSDLVIRQPGLRATVLCHLSRLFSSAESVSGRCNFLASTLRDKSLDWNPGQRAVARKSPALPKVAPSRRAA